MVNDKPLNNKNAAGTLGPPESSDKIETASGMPKSLIDGRVAQWLGADLQMLADNFWYDLPAEIAKISLQGDELALCIGLPFRKPFPSDEEGGWLSNQEDVDRIRIGFVNYLSERPLVRRRLANFFYSEFHTFLIAHTKRFRFGEAIRAKIERSGARRLAGRPNIPIPKRATEDVRRQVGAIYSVVLEIQYKIKSWKKRTHNISENRILERLKAEYDSDKYPWSRYAFQNARTLPAKRAYAAYKDGTLKDHQLTRPGVSEPERWSARDVAAQWTQIWFYRENGEQYDLREIRKLLRQPQKSNHS